MIQPTLSSENVLFHARHDHTKAYVPSQTEAREERESVPWKNTAEYTFDKDVSRFGFESICSARIGRLRMQALFQCAWTWMGTLRSLNHRIDALEWRLYSFRANKLRALSPLGEMLPSFARSVFLFKSAPAG